MMKLVKKRGWSMELSEEVGRADENRGKISDEATDEV